MASIIDRALYAVFKSFSLLHIEPAVIEDYQKYTIEYSRWAPMFAWRPIYIKGQRYWLTTIYRRVQRHWLFDHVVTTVEYATLFDILGG